MDGRFIATHVNGCTAYVIIMYLWRIAAILESTLAEQGWIVEVDSVEKKSQYQILR